MAGVVSGIWSGASRPRTPPQHLGAGSGRDDRQRHSGPAWAAVSAGTRSPGAVPIKLAEQTFPVIEVDAGREIDVVITKGVRIEGVDTAKASHPLPIRGAPIRPDAT